MFTLHEPIDPVIREELHAYDDTLAALLARRGITSVDAAEAFLKPSYERHLGDPLAITDMEKAARRVAAAIASKERIAVWSDYDCDGIPGGVLFHDFLKKAGANFTNYIPHRHLEGYGLNIGGIDTLAQDGVTLIITIDSGITDSVQVAHANTLGIDVIITDHHLPEAELPNAYAVVDPKRADETYPYRDFCGAGLAWRLVCATLTIGFPGRENIPLGWEKWLLDMAGMATIADMVPLTGENRVIAQYGLLVMRKSRRIGLQKLCTVARVNQRYITEEDVGFMLGPRINAASRMGNPRDAFELLTTDDEARAEELAKKLERLNRSRRALGAAVTRSARERVQERIVSGTLPSVIVLGDATWRPGLLGTVASNLAEEYSRPVFLWGRDGGVAAKGSCRTSAGISVVELMRAAPHAFTEYGGHAAAGGFTVADDAVAILEKTLSEALQTLPVRDGGTPYDPADGVITDSTDLKRLMKQVSACAPFGMENRQPTYLFQNAHITHAMRFGKSEEHLRITITRSGGDVGGICFFAARTLGSVAEQVVEECTRSLLVTLERDTFTRGQPIRFRIIAISS